MLTPVRPLGERRTPLALLLAGSVLGIPMFAETVFYLLVPLARAIWERTGRGYLLGVLAIVALPFHPVFIAMAIGCGSKMGMWMNDSGFWVVSRMSGMSEVQTLRTASVMLAIEGTIGLLATLCLAAAVMAGAFGG